ncbi:DMT family transporter [Methylobacterium organophilum]|uniref:DMT family transporter n=1 Tax=Methylobacterium organophilum TaxID=410 RepID=UPI001F13FBFE|nr:DMT family transporter [Methylobacterium organophilum]UMY16753.1 DMT family transporter [Methylobacterium organophilum]
MADSMSPALAPIRARVAVPNGVWLGLMVVLWGLSWPAMKLCLGEIKPLWLATLRFSTAGAALFGVLAFNGRLRLPARADWPVLASIGGLQMMAFTALGLVAMRHTDAGRAALLAYTTPVWVMLGAWLFLRERPSQAQTAAIGCGLTGVAVVCSPFGMDWTNPDILLGNALLLVCAACWAVVILHVRHHRWSMHPLDLAPWQMAFAAIPLAAAAYAIEGPLNVVWSPRLVGLLAFIGPVATSFCFVISAEVGRRISSVTLSNVTLAVPAIGILSSALLLGERLDIVLIVGLGCLTAAVITAARDSCHA